MFKITFAGSRMADDGMQKERQIRKLHDSNRLTRKMYRKTCFHRPPFRPVHLVFLLVKKFNESTRAKDRKLNER